MPHVAVLGGSVVGSVTGLLFARSGWQVTVVDPELERVRTDAAERLAVRPGAPHTVQAHGFMARTLHELTTRLPDVRTALVAEGAPLVPLAATLPPPLHDGGRPDDDELTTLRVRRVVMDRVVAEALAAQDGVRRVAGRAVGLLADDGPPVAVRGLVLDDGEQVTADVVVDAGGRRSPTLAWLAALGAVPEVRDDPCGARYYTRHYRVAPDAPVGLNRGFAEVHDFPSLTQLLFLGDNGTAMLAQTVHDHDTALTTLRRPEAFEATARGNADLQEWSDALEPISEVFALGAFSNRLHSLVPDGRPVVTGLHLVGDALARTNPTRGRGLSMGLSTVGRLHDVLAGDELTGADAQVAVDGWVRGPLATYYRETAATDAAFDRRRRAALLGRSVPVNAPAVELPEGHPVSSDELGRAAGTDPDLMRLVMRAAMLLDDDRRVAAPEVADRVRAVLAGAPPRPEPGPEPTGGFHDRDRLLETLAPFA